MTCRFAVKLSAAIIVAAAIVSPAHGQQYGQNPYGGPRVYVAPPTAPLLGNRPGIVTTQPNGQPLSAQQYFSQYPVGPLMRNRFIPGSGQTYSQPTTNYPAYGYYNGYYGYYPTQVYVPYDAYDPATVVVGPGGISYGSANAPVGVDPSQVLPPATNVYNTYNYNYYGAQTAAPDQAAPQTQPDMPPATGSANPTGAPLTPSPAPAAQPSGSAGSGATPSSAQGDDADILAADYNEILKGWLTGDVSLIKKHVDPAGTISILSGGRYEYTESSGRYLDAVTEVMGQIQTKSFTFSALRKQPNGDITAFATQVYTMLTGDTTTQQTNYVSLGMSKRPAGWVIIAVDSSSTPLISLPASGNAGGQS